MINDTPPVIEIPEQQIDDANAVAMHADPRRRAIAAFLPNIGLRVTWRGRDVTDTLLYDSALDAMQSPMRQGLTFEVFASWTLDRINAPRAIVAETLEPR